VLRGRTGKDAVYLGRMAADQQGYIIAQDGSSFALCLNSYYSEEEEEGEDYRVYLYTDRPVYRPGQTVMFKGIVRRQISNENGVSYQPLSHHDLTVQVRDAEDHLIARQPVRTNAIGTFSGSLTLDKEPAIGWYTLQVQLGSENHRGYFWVAEYQKPDFFVEVSAPRETRIGGDRVPVTIRARYYMGRPVAGATVELFGRYYDEIEDTDMRPDEDEDNPYGGDPWRPDWFEGIYDEEEFVLMDEENRLKLGDLRTNRDGVCLVSLPTQAVKARSRLRLAAWVTDTARRSAGGGTSISLAPADYSLMVSTDRFWYASGDTVRLNITAHDLNAQPAVCRVAIAATAVAWDERDRQPLLSRTLTTDKNGRASLTLTAPNSPYLEVAAQVKDDRGRTMQVRRQIWIATATPSRAGRRDEKPELNATADRSFYRVGESASIALRTAGIGTTALVCVERERILDYRLVSLRSGTGTLNLPLPRRYAPNVTLHASVAHIGGYGEDSEVLFIPPREKFLRVSVTADRPTYRPGERARFTVQTHDDNGQPVSAEVSLGLVDEAIYAVRGEESPDLRRYFYGAQHSKVVTFYSAMPHDVTAEAGGNGAEYEVRKDFPDTAYWNAHVVTDATGKAVVDVKLPDSLTSWRATVRAVTADTKVGTAKHNITVNLPFFVRLAPPPFLTQGDEVSIPVAVHNDTAAPVSARASLAAQGATLLSPEAQTLSVPVGFPLQTQ
ncbi:MAG: MG2 domain-containing protein, partial [Abditibacteriales bacterium]|nr:MG2 domain-containing protein [Abditibacteriales bacterium]